VAEICVEGEYLETDGPCFGLCIPCNDPRWPGPSNEEECVECLTPPVSTYPCECEGKVSFLELSLPDGYIVTEVVGKKEVNVAVFTQDGPNVTIASLGDNLGTMLTIRGDGWEIKIHTSCSVPIGPGCLFCSSDMSVCATIISGRSGKRDAFLCPYEEGTCTSNDGDDDDDEVSCDCEGKVNYLELVITPTGTTVDDVTGKKDEVDFTQVGDLITITPVGDDDDRHEHHETLGTEVRIEVGGVTISVHTSCSKPIGPGCMFCEGAYCVEVVAGTSAQFNAPLCEYTPSECAAGQRKRGGWGHDDDDDDGKGKGPKDPPTVCPVEAEACPAGSFREVDRLDHTNQGCSVLHEQSCASNNKYTECVEDDEYPGGAKCCKPDHRRSGGHGKCKTLHDVHDDDHVDEGYGECHNCTGPIFPNAPIELLECGVGMCPEDICDACAPGQACNGTACITCPAGMISDGFGCIEPDPHHLPHLLCIKTLCYYRPGSGKYVCPFRPGCRTELDINDVTGPIPDEIDDIGCKKIHITCDGGCEWGGLNGTLPAIHSKCTEDFEVRGHKHLHGKLYRPRGRHLKRFIVCDNDLDEFEEDDDEDDDATSPPEMQEMDVGNNNIQDRIPNWLTERGKTRFRGNRLFGVPPERCFDEPESCEEIDEDSTNELTSCRTERKLKKNKGRRNNKYECDRVCWDDRHGNKKCGGPGNAEVSEPDEAGERTFTKGKFRKGKAAYVDDDDEEEENDGEDDYPIPEKVHNHKSKFKKFKRRQRTHTRSARRIAFRDHSGADQEIDGGLFVGVETLSFVHPNLGSTIPAVYSEELEELEINAEHVTGPIPDLATTWPNLKRLYIHANITGVLPCPVQNMTAYVVTGSEGGASLPTNCSRDTECSTCLQMDVSDMNLEGVVPAWVLDPARLTHFDARNNHFTWVEVPESITFPCNGNSERVDLRGNAITERLPEELCNDAFSFVLSKGKYYPCPHRLAPWELGLVIAVCVIGCFLLLCTFYVCCVRPRGGRNGPEYIALPTRYT